MPKILIVDDDLDWVKVLSMRLRQGGFETVAAEDAYRGVEAARKEKPNAIVLDIAMPAGGGMATLRNIRMTTQGMLVPVVVSGTQDSEIKKQIAAAGVAAFISKPCKAEDVLEAVRKALEGATAG